MYERGGFGHLQKILTPAGIDINACNSWWCQAYTVLRATNIAGTSTNGMNTKVM